MSNALDKLRVRLASEGYKSMNGENKEKIEIDEVAHDGRPTVLLISFNLLI